MRIPFITTGRERKAELARLKDKIEKLEKSNAALLAWVNTTHGVSGAVKTQGIRDLLHR